MSDIIPRTFEIQLTKGYVAFVDEQDADLNEFKWYPAIKNHGKVYVWRKTLFVPEKEKKTIHIHRVIMSRVLGRELDTKEQVDHKDLNPLNNRRSNLRLATHSQNNSNKITKVGRSGYKGVWWSNVGHKWVAAIKINKKSIHLGYFDDPKEAYNAYCEAAKKYHGEFARFE